MEIPIQDSNPPTVANSIHIRPGSNTNLEHNRSSSMSVGATRLGRKSKGDFDIDLLTWLKTPYNRLTIPVIINCIYWPVLPSLLYCQKYFPINKIRSTKIKWKKMNFIGTQEIWKLAKAVPREFYLEIKTMIEIDVWYFPWHFNQNQFLTFLRGWNWIIGQIGQTIH